MDKLLNIFFGLLSAILVVAVDIFFAIISIEQEKKIFLLFLLPMTLVEIIFLWLVVPRFGKQRSQRINNTLYLGLSFAMISFFIGSLFAQSFVGTIFTWACFSLVATNGLAQCLTRYDKRKYNLSKESKTTN